MKEKVLSCTFVLLMLLMGGCRSDGQRPPGCYMVMWKYNVEVSKQSQFEEVYGHDGTWADFFSESSDYFGTCLSRNPDAPSEYILIDAWSGKEAYEKFKNENKSRYDSLSRTYSTLYAEEARIGAYENLR